ncbi:hypothetical protein R3P38DRAFT_2758725 [Favolaschia claudopus]|uniref:Uncharacterized protein n=1 Tax=Favolaschia claudopus TaxID=2862362 RepID=A0AAW0EEK4_9AGAR
MAAKIYNVERSENENKDAWEGERSEEKKRGGEGEEMKSYSEEEEGVENGAPLRVWPYKEKMRVDVGGETRRMRREKKKAGREWQRTFPRAAEKDGEAVERQEKGKGRTSRGRGNEKEEKQNETTTHLLTAVLNDPWLPVYPLSHQTCSETYKLPPGPFTYSRRAKVYEEMREAVRTRCSWVQYSTKVASVEKERKFKAAAASKLSVSWRVKDTQRLDSQYTVESRETERRRDYKFETAEKFWITVDSVGEGVS